MTTHHEQQHWNPTLGCPHYFQWVYWLLTQQYQRDVEALRNDAARNRIVVIQKEDLDKLGASWRLCWPSANNDLAGSWFYAHSLPHTDLGEPIETLEIGQWVQIRGIEFVVEKCLASCQVQLVRA